MKTILRWFSILPALLILLLIFNFSAQDGPTSGSLSFKVSYTIISLANRLFSFRLSKTELFSRAEAIQLIVRKLAHMTEYFTLALSIYLPLRVWLPYKGVSVSGKHFFIRLILPTFLLSVLFAATDEFHQSFVPGRCGTPVDVLVDSIGIVTACILLTVYNRCIRKRRNLRNSYAK